MKKIWKNGKIYEFKNRKCKDVTEELSLTYQYFKIEFNSVQELFDVKNPIEIFQQFINSVDENNIDGCNFNRYYFPTQGIIHPCLDIRMNLVEAEIANSWGAIQETARLLLTNNRIRWWSNRLEPWNEPDFVVQAHEIASNCAIVFKENLDSNPQTLQKLSQNPDEFMWLFAVSLLRQSGFNPKIAWTYLSSAIDTDITTLATECSEVLIDAIGTQTPNVDFIERFIHTFFNCTVGNEQTLLNRLSASNTINNIVDSWQNPEE